MALLILQLPVLHYHFSSFLIIIKMKIQSSFVVFWFRRDLRLIDNAALFAALSGEFNVLPIFIFDDDILDKLDRTTDTRISFIIEALNY